jgi:hypothetical protein
MSLKIRHKRINLLAKKWKLKKINPLIVSYKIKNDFFEEFKFNIKLYISKALKIKFEHNDKKFIKNIDKARNNRLNITPNGAIVPKREFHLEYNLVLRSWCELVKQMSSKDKKLLKLFRITPNIRIKFGKELNDNKNRSLSTSYPHSDAWVEGPWGMNCFIPFFGDTKRNTLKFYEPKDEFKESFLNLSASYKDMQWVLKYYKPIENLKIKQGYVNISDYAAIHHTNRKINSGTRVSIDTTFLIGNFKMHKDKMREYTKKYLASVKIISLTLVNMKKINLQKK